jgi:hypothetical protein
MNLHHQRLYMVLLVIVVIGAILLIRACSA